MTREEAIQHIEKEFAAARVAEKNGNEGMVRVCARRAAGIAIGFWLESNPRKTWGVDAMSRLRALQLDDSIPQEVKESAKRLTTKITERFTSPFPTHPLDDAQQIIQYFLA